MAIFKNLNRLTETFDQKEYEREMREALKNGSQKKPDNQAPNYSHVKELSAWSGFDQHKAILNYLEGYPDGCWKYLEQTDNNIDGSNGGPWCIERLSETDLGTEGPSVGLKHEIFYNQSKVGTVKLKPTTRLPDSIESADDSYHGVIVEIEIEGVLLIKADHVQAFINVAVMPICDFEPKAFTDDWRFMYQWSMQKAIHNTVANQSPLEPLDFFFHGAVKKARIDIQGH